MIINLHNARKESKNSWIADIDQAKIGILKKKDDSAKEDAMYTLVVKDRVTFKPKLKIVSFNIEKAEIKTIGTLFTNSILIIEEFDHRPKHNHQTFQEDKNKYDYSVWSKFSREIEQLSIRQNKLAILLRDIIRDVSPKGYLKYNESSSWFIEEPGENWAIKIQKEKFLIKLKGSILEYRQRRINLNFEKAGKNACKFIYSEKFQLKEIKKALEEAKFN